MTARRWLPYAVVFVISTALLTLLVVHPSGGTVQLAFLLGITAGAAYIALIDRDLD